MLAVLGRMALQICRSIERKQHSQRPAELIFF
jgi:hypothetical protein